MDPVGMADLDGRALLAELHHEPLPNCFSIWDESPASMALPLDRLLLDSCLFVFHKFLRIRRINDTPLTISSHPLS